MLRFHAIHAGAGVCSEKASETRDSAADAIAVGGGGGGGGDGILARLPTRWGAHYVLAG